LASRPLALPVPVVVVPEVAVAMGRLAVEFRRRRNDATWIGVSGANGKTTVKELLVAAIGGPAVVHATAGNLNNQLGVPLTMLATPATARVVVVELGGDHEGEIDGLAAIVAPGIGVMTSVGPAHLEGYVDLAGVARGESAVFRRVAPEGACFFGGYGLTEVAGADADRLLALVRASAGARRLTVIGDVDHPVSGRVLTEGIELDTPAGTVAIALQGRHNLANAALAYAVATTIGVPPPQVLAGLARVTAVAGRLRRLPLGRHVVLDDSYNANPGSVIAGLEVLAGLPNRRLAVLGEMAELGTTSMALHRQVGEAAARRGLSLIVVGAGAAGIAEGYRAAGGGEAVLAADPAAAIAAVIAHCASGPTAVLVKASHSAGLERVVTGLHAGLGGTAC
jgi:UDP-N-acetylmuramoyl-tripeptide--D-alanyl-D-alanine ligase